MSTDTEPLVPVAPRGRRPHCRQCRIELPLYTWRNSQFARELGRVYGYEGSGYFCSLRCGYQYGLALLQTEKKG